MASGGPDSGVVDEDELDEVAHMADLAPDSAEAHAAEVEAASDPSKDDEAEQAVETAPSSPSDANDASANVRAEDVREDKDSPAASKGDGGFREEGSDSDALQLDGAGEVASALAAMMSAVGGLQKSIGSLEEVELPIDSAPLAVEEKDGRPAPGGVAEILAGLNAAMGPLREEAPETPAPAAEQELSLEELEDRVLLQKVLVKQLRSDYEARFERSQSLQQALDDLGTEPQELQVDVVRARNAAAQLRRDADEAAMWAEDRVAQGWRLYEARRQSHEVARCLAKETGEDLQALRRSKGHVSEEVAKEVLAEQQQRIETLKQDARAQDEKLLSLRADLSSVLDFIVRVHIDQQGGPSRRIVRHELLPAEFTRAVRFSDLGEAQLQELVKRYEEALMGDPSKAPGDSTGSIAASTPSAVAAPLQRRPPPPLPSHEPASSSFAQERLLLRSRLNEEMQKVAAILANDSTMPSAGYPTQDCQREELLRAAAWGETRSIKELLSAGAGSSSSALRGWTAWHAAAAHAQDRAIAFLAQEMPEGIDAVTDCGLPALGIACIRGYVDCARTLIQCSASPEQLDARGNGPLHWAAASYADKSANDLAEMLLEAGADPFACNGSGQLPDIPNLQDMALAQAAAHRQQVPRTSAGGAARAVRSQQPKRRAERPAPLESTEGLLPAEQEEEELPNYFCIRLEKGSGPGGLLASLGAALKPPVRDRAGILRRAEARRTVHLSPDEEDVGLWSEWVTNYTHAGLERAVSTAEPPSCDPTNSQRNSQALVLTSERLLFLRCGSRAAMATGWSVAEGVALSGLRQVIVPQRCETLLLIRIRSSADILLNFPPGSRDAFLEELWQAMVRAGWPGLHVTESDSPDEPPKDFVVVDPDAVLPLLDLSGQRQEAAVGTLAFVEPNVFALLPRASASLLLSGAETARFGFMDLQRRVQPKAAGAGVCWQWQRHFFVLKAGRLNDRCIGWCRHPNSEKWSGQVLLQNITQVRSFRGSAKEACLLIESRGQAPVTVKARNSKERDEWLDGLRKLGAADRIA